MLLFRSEEHVNRWCSSWGFPQGATLSPMQTWQLAHAWYRNKVRPDWRRHTLAETEAMMAEIGLTGPEWNLRS